MSSKGNKKSKTFPVRLEAQLKSKGASLPTRLDGGAPETPSRVKMNAHRRAPLTAFPAPMLPCALFTVDSGRCRHTQDDVILETRLFTENSKLYHYPALVWKCRRD